MIEKYSAKISRDNFLKVTERRIEIILENDKELGLMLESCLFASNIGKEIQVFASELTNDREFVFSFLGYRIRKDSNSFLVSWYHPFEIGYNFSQLKIKD